MEKFRHILAVIFYLIWIPLGVLLLAGIIFMIMANPFAGMMGMMSGGPGGFDQSSSGGFPSEEMMKKFMQEGGQPPGGSEGFGPPSDEGPAQ